jgi:tyrosyl-tRNA synthetase
MPPSPPLDELAWRGLLHQQTEGLDKALREGQLAGYCGFDPTASSLHVGSLLPVMALVHLQHAGHRPIGLVGGGTGMIGDPSGKTAERQLLTPEAVATNANGLRRQLERFLDFEGPRGAMLVDNAEWLRPLHAIDFMRDVGKYFRVNAMLAKESVRARLESEAGISYTEFSYMLLQAYDFLELARRADVTLQVGGSDQWGNITAGIDLIRRVLGREAHGLTVPLVTTTTGTKFGKTEAGTVWLDAERTTPYQFYQFWINSDDRDVGRWLRYFTLMPREEIAALDRATSEHPERREAQQALARAVTTTVHGADAAGVAEEVSALLFGAGDPRALSLEALEALRAEVPFVEVAANGDGSGGAASGTLDVLDLFAATRLAPSKGAARRLLEQGGLNLNGRRLSATERQVTADAFLPGRHLLLRKGARDYALVRVTAASI